MTQPALRLAETPPADDIQSRAAAARDELERLGRARTKAQTTFEQAIAASVTDPTEKTITAKLVAEQLAANARAAYDDHETATQPLLREAAFANYAAELKALRQELRSPALDGARQTLIDLLGTFRRELRATAAGLYEAVADRNKQIRRAQTLADALGFSERFGHVSIDEVVREISLGINPSQGYVDTDSYSIAINNTTGTPALERLLVGLDLVIGDLANGSRS